MTLFTKNRLTFICLAVAAAAPARANIIFNTTYTSAVTGLGPTVASEWESAFNYATSVYSGDFTDNITINLTVNAVPGTGTLGGSRTSLGIISDVSPESEYADLKAALVADVKDATDASAVAHLPATDPVSGPNEWVVTFAQAKALGFFNPNGTENDGTITFGEGFNYTFDPNHRAVAGEYDFIGIAEHEITEVMGRIGLLGTIFPPPTSPNPPNYAVLDLLGYTAPGDLSLNQTNDGVYFSIDGGNTDLFKFNNPGGGDLRDWASGQGPDSYNAFTTSGVENDVSNVDLLEMDAIGYDLQAPEPATLLPMLLGVALLALRLRRAAAQA